MDFPGGSDGKASVYNVRDLGLIPGLGTTERLHFHFSLSCIGEGNGNPLQCSCLENPGDGGAWWAAVSGVAQSWTRLKRLNSSSIFFFLPFWLIPIFLLFFFLLSYLIISASFYYIFNFYGVLPSLTCQGLEYFIIT